MNFYELGMKSVVDNMTEQTMIDLLHFLIESQPDIMASALTKYEGKDQ